jgi:hypothetical protein
MKNYAWHRLSPWFGHLMVSRQETSRPLLTPEGASRGCDQAPQRHRYALYRVKSYFES